ncbi:OmpP1/FadL family transporter [Carboxylicivirga sp. RSCT41]|uniref:OmpP1/FadL family transporter n=1 Tax=Carboxylicivirga agarovorans TaxID=3417570 RepID=UPI003D344249
MNKLRLLTLVFISALTLSVAATNGYYFIGFGTLSKGMGGTGVAYYKTSLIGNNPAGRVHLGKQFNVSGTLLFPTTSYNVIGNPSGIDGTLPLAPGKVESDIKLLFIPNLGANWQLNEKSAFGVSVYGNGLSCEYPTQTYWDPSSETTDITYYQIYIDPSYSYKINEKHSIGFSAMILSQMFEINGMNTFAALSSSPENVSGNGADLSFGIGAKIGYLGELFDGFYLGATYQTRAYSSKLDKYEGLLAEQGSMDAPSTWTIGINYEISDKWRALFDVQQINYSEVKSLSNKFLSQGALGADNGPGFGWEDMTVFKFGTEYQVNEGLALRAGYAFGEEPVRESEVFFNIMAPMVHNQHFTIGATKGVGNNGNAINMALTYAPSNSMKAASPMDPAQQIELDLELFELELSFTF